MRKLNLHLRLWLSVLAAGALFVSCDKPFAPPENPASPVPAGPREEKATSTYLSHEEMMSIYNYVVQIYQAAQVQHAKIMEQKRAGGNSWLAGWAQWMRFTEDNGRIIAVKRSRYDLSRYQDQPKSPLPCLDQALLQLRTLLDLYGRNISQNLELDPTLDSTFRTQLDQCKQLLERWEPPEEFSGTPPPKIK